MRPSRRRPPLFAIALAIAAALSVSAPAAQAEACPGADVLPAAAWMVDSKTSTLCLLNVERGNRGLQPLASDPLLDGLATSYSAAMVRQEFFAHVSPAGQLLDQRLAQYYSGARVWDIGENLAWGESWKATPQAIVDGWMGSDAHRANVLNPRFSEIGIGIVNGSPAGSVPQASATYATEFGTLTASGAGAARGASRSHASVPAATKRRIAAQCARFARRTRSTRAARRVGTARCVSRRLRAAAAARS